MTPFFGLLSAAKPPPLVDIDATVFVQLGIFLLLLIVLTRFVFKPFLALRAERAQRIEGAREEAETLNADVAKKLARYEEQLLATRKEAGSVRLEQRKESETAAAAKLAEARKSTDATVGAAREKLEKSVQAAQLALRARADVIARVVVGKLLGREV